MSKDKKVVEYIDRLIDNTPTSRLACMVEVDANLDNSEINIFNFQKITSFSILTPH